FGPARVPHVFRRHAESKRAMALRRFMIRGVTKVRRRKPIACLISACRRKTCRTRAGRIAQRGGGAPSQRLGGCAGGGRSRHPARRRRIEAERVPPPPRTAVSGHAPSARRARGSAG